MLHPRKTEKRTPAPLLQLLSSRLCSARALGMGLLPAPANIYRILAAERKFCTLAGLLLATVADVIRGISRFTGSALTRLAPCPCPALATMAYAPLLAEVDATSARGRTLPTIWSCVSPSSNAASSPSPRISTTLSHEPSPPSSATRRERSGDAAHEPPIVTCLMPLLLASATRALHSLPARPAHAAGDTQISASPALSSLVRPRYRPQPLACTLPDTGRARPSPFSLLLLQLPPLRVTQPTISHAPLSSQPLPVLVNPVVVRSSAPSLPFLHAHLVRHRDVHICRNVGAGGIGGGKRRGRAVTAVSAPPACNILSSPSIVFGAQGVPGSLLTSAHLLRSGGRYYYPGYPRGAYGYGESRCPASYTPAGMRDTLTVTRLLFSFPVALDNL
ncbi:hypothetical protein DFH06DRAFT_1472944 [Mycena polygramma]|nr:hypothetical protein DFH06DRAFT_1472944 [Mycena polygramma]